MPATKGSSGGASSGGDVGSSQGGLGGAPAYEQINGDDVSEGRPKEGQPTQEPTSASRKSADQPPADGTKVPEPPLPKSKL